MSGAELGTPEFAYLLAAVQADEVIGLDAAGLFPTSLKKQDQLYSQGRAELEDNGWLKPLDASQNEYDLNSDLFEIVAMIANPDYVVATLREAPAEASGFTLHYITPFGVADLVPMASDRFHLGVVADRSELAARVSEMLGLHNNRPAVRGALPQASFKKMVAAAKKGQAEKAEALLNESGEIGTKASSLVTAAGEQPSGHLIVLPGSGAAELGRRVTVLGQDKAAWLVFNDEEDEGKIVFANGSQKNIETIISEWTNESAD